MRLNYLNSHSMSRYLQRVLSSVQEQSFIFGLIETLFLHSNEVSVGVLVRIKHFCVNVKDLDKSIDFYCNTLGLELSKRFELPEDDLEIALVVGEESDIAVELVCQRGKRGYIMGDHLGHLAFIVGDVDSTVRELKSKGVQVVREPFTFIEAGLEERLAFVKDPDGILLELSS